QVGDATDAQYTHAHVAGNDGLRHGGHADEIGAQTAKGANLGGRFEAGAGGSQIYAFVERDASKLGYAAGRLLSQRAKLHRVGLGHVEKAESRPRRLAKAWLIG